VGAVLRTLQARGAARTYTDVASIKAGPQADVQRQAPEPGSFVGGHPLAGRERSGPGAARADLFAGRPWVLTPEAGTEAEHVERVHALVLACGAVPVVMSPEAHDEAVALVSHAPQVAASLLAARLVEAPDQAVALAGQGLRDTTRIAASDSALWTAVLAGNAGHVAAVLHALRDDLDEVLATLDALAGGAPVDAGVLTRAIDRGNAGRDRLPGKHGAAPTTYAVVPVVIPDRPGELARIFAAAGAAGVNIEDVGIEHSPGRPMGLLELSVRPSAADSLAAALAREGWTVHR
jgi:prephenate dehydrogenase